MCVRSRQERVRRRRDEVVAAVTDHADQIARELARLEGADYGQVTVDTDPASLAVASADDAVQERERVCSRVRETCDAMAAQLHRCASDDYGTFTAHVDGVPAFVDAFNDHVREVSEALATVDL